MSGINGMSADTMLQLLQSFDGKSGSKASLSANSSIKTSTSGPAAIVSLSSGSKASASQGNYVFKNLIPSSYNTAQWGPMAALPEFTGLTKGESKISKEELCESIINLAKEHAAKGAEYADNLPDITKLIDQYICYASPDRAGIIAEGGAGMTYPSGIGSNAVVGTVVDKETGDPIADYVVGQGWVTYAAKEETEARAEFYQLYYDTFFGKNTDSSTSSSTFGAPTADTTNSTTNHQAKIDYKA